MLDRAKAEDVRLKAGIKCAAPALRMQLIEVKKLCDEGRKDALERGKAIPMRERKPRGAIIEPEIEAEAEVKVEPPVEVKKELAPKPKRVRKPKAQSSSVSST